MDVSDCRFFANPFDDYDNSDLLDGSSLKPSLSQQLINHISKLFKCWQTNFTVDSNDTSVYTGAAGGALLYLKLFELESSKQPSISNENLLLKADSIVDKCLDNLKKNRYTFLCGYPGSLTIKVLINFLLNKDYKNYLKQISDIAPIVCNNSNIPDEVLYGRAGYLYCLLLIRSKLPDSLEIIGDDLIRTLLTSIIESGRNAARKENANIPLVYYWHKKAYVGAAHGYCGIIYMLLEASDYLTQEELNSYIRPTIDFICNLQFANTGNFPSSLGKSEDKLVHWCHGSPGVIHLLILAYKKFSDIKYLHSAIKISDDIWKRGLLKKGFGICHGVSGNGYAFLRLYQLTSDQKYLYRALKFADWCCEFSNCNIRVPDRPFSLFEGLGGTIYFLIDLLDPISAKFPAFQIDYKLN